MTIENENLKLEITVTGPDHYELANALGEVIRLVEDDCTSGQDGNGMGEFNFSIRTVEEGQAELLIILEGGIVQNIVSNRPADFSSMKIKTIDYDVDGIAEEDLSFLCFDGGTKNKALVNVHSIEEVGF